METMKVRGPKSGFRKTIPLRRKLRHDTTRAEQIFWAQVARRQYLGLKFRRQHGIGKYVVDFYCAELKLVIEIDGDTHADSRSDFKRTAYLESLGYHVVRYQNRDIIHNVEGVFENLAMRARALRPPLSLPLTRGRK